MNTGNASWRADHCGTRHLIGARWPATAAIAATLLTTCLAGCTSQSPAPAQHSGSAQPTTGAQSATQTLSGISKIRHVVIIMQENRSFDSFFGTYPGADGIPAKNGQFTVCVPDPRTKGCDKPYHDSSLVNGGAGHNLSDGIADIDGGKMDGFVKSAEDASTRGCSSTNPPTPVCLPSNPPDVMGYHDAREIPNYWTYANDFVLQDHMFEPVDSWSLPAHLYLVSGWSAHCTSTNPDSCTNDPEQAAAAAQGLNLNDLPAAFRSCMAAHGVTKLSTTSVTDPKVIAAGEACLRYLTPADLQLLLGNGGEEASQLGLYSWTDLTYLLHKANVSWAYYVQSGIQPDCDDNPDQTAAGCAPVAQGSRTPFDLEPAALLHRRQGRWPARQRPEPVGVLHRRRARHAPGGVVDRPDPGQ